MVALMSAVVPDPKNALSAVTSANLTDAPPIV